MNKKNICPLPTLQLPHRLAHTKSLASTTSIPSMGYTKRSKMNWNNFSSRKYFHLTSLLAFILWVCDYSPSIDAIIFNIKGCRILIKFQPSGAQSPFNTRRRRRRRRRLRRRSKFLVRMRHGCMRIRRPCTGGGRLVLVPGHWEGVVRAWIVIF